ncbi:MAG TPA: hypothetical protein VF666_04270 [Pyrinomonadaceae bacterium]|jgi:hypothetical protein
MLRTLPGLVVLLLSCSACATNGRNAETARAPRANSSPSNAAVASSPRAPDIQSDKTVSNGSGKFNQYKFTFRRNGNNATATFASPKLPWRDALVVAAAREIIVAAFNDRSENFPRPVRWNYEGEQVSAIKLEGNDYEFVFVPVRDKESAEGTKEVASIVFWRLNKGSVK